MTTHISSNHHPNPHQPPSDFSAYLNPQTSPPQALTNDTLNLSVLRRHLPSTHSILHLAQYAVVYIFSPTTSAWEKAGIEGTLFVVRLHPHPHSQGRARYAVIVLNRRGLDNFVLELTSRDEVDVAGEYIILRGETGEAYGLWVFEEEEGSTSGKRRVVGDGIVECAMWAGGGGVQQLQQQAPQSPDLMALLNGSRVCRESPPRDMYEGRDVLGELFRRAGENSRD